MAGGESLNGSLGSILDHGLEDLAAYLAWSPRLPGCRREDRSPWMVLAADCSDPPSLVGPNPAAVGLTFVEQR